MILGFAVLGASVDQLKGSIGAEGAHENEGVPRSCVIIRRI